MQILDNFIIIALLFFSFYAGLRVANYYNAKYEYEKKDALEKQFIRLKTQSDADDPCKPYKFTPPYNYTQSVPQSMPVTDQQPAYNPNYPPGDYDGDSPIGASFMNDLKTNGCAKTTFRKSDLSK